MAIIADEKEIRIERLVLGAWETNCYIVVAKATKDSLAADAPANASDIIGALAGTKPRYILLTHGHFDHTGTLKSLRARLKAPLAAHASDAASLKTPPEITAGDGDVLKLGELEITVLHTPGHTPGSLCYKIGKYLIAGDTIFPGGPGHTDTAGDFRQIVESITGKILTLPDDTVILPGHGDGTTVKQAREEYAAFAAGRHPGDLYGDVLWQNA